jgi:retron-type reverse transcriptase
VLSNFARYADDLLILVRSRRSGERLKTSVTRYLHRVLKLSINEQKSRVCRTDEVVFLGFTFRGTCAGPMKPSMTFDIESVNSRAAVGA